MLALAHDLSQEITGTELVLSLELTVRVSRPLAIFCVTGTSLNKYTQFLVMHF